MTREEEKYTTLDTEQCKWWVNNLFGMAKEQACNSRNFDDAEEIQSAQDKIIEALVQQTIAEERYQDLVKYFGDKNVAKCILEDREEFKKWLERIKWHVCKADELARKLEQQSDDCVSRAEVKKWLDINFCFGGAINKLNFFEKMDKEVPPVTPTQSWIPVSERLPEEETDVLICNANKEIAISRGSYSTEIENAFIWYTSGWRFGEVIAWQPLPKPYEKNEVAKNE